MYQSRGINQNMRSRRFLFRCIICIIILFFACHGSKCFAEGSDDFEIKDGVLVKYTGTASEVVIPNGVTKIGLNAFRILNESLLDVDNETLTSVVIPDSVTEIDSGAFMNCVNLNSVKMSKNVTSIGTFAFYNCKELHHITLPDMLEGISSSSFAESGLISIKIPKSVTSIDNNAFKGCKKLNVAKISSGVQTIGEYAFSDTNITEIIIPETVTKLGKNVFYNCKSLSRVIIHKGINSIPENAFYGCENLLGLTIPIGVTSIEKNAFYQCSSLLEVKFPYTLIEIQEGAFYGCKNLINLEIPLRVTTIGDRAFGACSKLNGLQLPQSITSIGKEVISITEFPYTFDDHLETIYYTGTEEEFDAIPLNLSKERLKDRIKYETYFPEEESIISQMSLGYVKASDININGDNGFWVMDGLLYKYTGDADEVSIPEGVNFIDENVFKDNTKIKRVNIPKGVYGIGSSAFEGCTGLKEVYLPESIFDIGKSAFSCCSSLERIKLSNFLQCIREKTFYKCSRLTSYGKPEWILSIGDEAFYGTALTSLNLNDGLLSIGSGAFKECNYLKDASLPASVRFLGGSAFYNDKALSNIKLSENLKRIESSTFYFCNITNIDIPEGVTEIKGNAFASTGKMTNVNFPTTLKKINLEAFTNNYDLVALTLPDGLEELGNRAFQHCVDLKYLYIPESLKKIGTGVFYGDSEIEKVYYGGTEEEWKALCESGIGGLEYKEILFEQSAEDINKQLKVYTITYNLNGGRFMVSAPSGYTAADLPLTIDNPVKDSWGLDYSYRFVGWIKSPDENAVRDITIPEGTTDNIELTAVFIEIYPITYDLDGGYFYNNSNPTYYSYEDEFELKNPNRSGYIFLGWTGSNGDVPQKEVKIKKGTKEKLSFKANWVEYYDITYDLDGGTVSENNPVTYTSLSEDILINNPTKEDKEFLGWMGTDIGTEPVKTLIIPKGSKGDREYTAIWKDGIYDKDRYTIEYRLDGGVMDGNPESYTSDDQDILIKRPHKDDYSFAGWWVMGDGNIFVKWKDDSIKDIIIPHGSRGNLILAAMFVECDHEEMETEPAIEPTCTEAGRTEYTHCGCEKNKSGGEVIPALGHQYDEGVVTKEPKVGEKGIRTFTCQRCKETKTEEIPALEDNSKGNVTDNPNKDDTVTDVNPNDPDKTPKEGEVGWTFKTSKGYFKITKAGKEPEVAFLSPVSTKKTSAVIPNTVKKKGITYKVTSIGDNAFVKCKKKLKKVTIGTKVKSIGKNAFKGCKKLKTVTIKTKSIKSIGKNAFKGINSKAKFKLPKKLSKKKVSKYKKMIKKAKAPKKAKITK